MFSGLRQAPRGAGAGAATLRSHLGSRHESLHQSGLRASSTSSTGRARGGDGRRGDSRGSRGGGGGGGRGGRGGGRGREWVSKYHSKQKTYTSASELLANTERMGKPANKSFVRGRPAWIPEDPIHDPLPPTRLNQFEKDKKTLWARMNELGAFRDIDSYRQVVSELVPKGLDATAADMDVTDEAFEELQRQYQNSLKQLEAENPAVTQEWNRQIGPGTNVQFFEDYQSRSADAAWVFTGEMPDFRPQPNEGAPPRTTIMKSVLQTKRTTNMKRAGRRNMMNALAVAGNGDGAAGYALAKSTAMATAVQKASALAEKRMVAIERRNEHTIHHDVSAKFISTRVYMQHAPKGHGLICHRAIWEICRVAGIHDLIANVRGSVTPANVCRATFMCFEKQSQNLLLERTVASNLMALEYSSLQLMPSVAVTAPPQSVSKLDAAEPRVVLPTNEIREITASWLRTFPLKPTAKNFEFARLIRHGLLVRRVKEIELEPVPEAITDAIDRARASHGALVEWLEAMPTGADPSFGPMYPLHAETLRNCTEYPEFDYDDDGLLYHEDVEHELGHDRS